MNAPESSVAVSLPPRLTIESAAETLQGLWQDLSRQGGRDAVALDARALSEFDTSAVAVLLELRRRLAKVHRQMTVVNQPEHLVDLIRLYGVGELLAA